MINCVEISQILLSLRLNSYRPITVPYITDVFEMKIISDSIENLNSFFLKNSQELSYSAVFKNEKCCL